MLLTILRALFVLLIASVTLSYLSAPRVDTLPQPIQDGGTGAVEEPSAGTPKEPHGSRAAWESFQVDPFTTWIICVGLAVLIIGIDIFIPQKSLMALSGVFFGLLVGLVITYAGSLVLDLLADTFRQPLAGTMFGFMLRSPATKVLLGVAACYLSISFILQTKDDVRFVIPYVEFAKQRKGQHPMILDTSVIIDGRIVDILNTWYTDTPVIIPRFVIQELQTIADSNDKLKRNRGRRGLDIVNKLQSMPKLDLQFEDVRSAAASSESVDQKLVTLAIEVEGRIVTNDYNLNKVARIRGVEVMNVNDLANALKPVFLPGESMEVKIIKPGEEAGQGIGYLEDGTMVVVESGRDHIGRNVSITVTSVLQTSAGRMVFGKFDGTAAERPRRRPSSSAPRTRNDE